MYVCTSDLSGQQRPRKTKIGTKVTHVTRDSDSTFKVKRSMVKVTRPVYSPRRLRTGSWERIERGKLLLRCRLQARRSARRREVLRRPQGEERGGAYRVATCTACYRHMCESMSAALSHDIPRRTDAVGWVTGSPAKSLTSICQGFLFGVPAQQHEDNITRLTTIVQENPG